MISFVIPVFNEAGNVSELAKRIATVVKKDFEIIFVDDGSTDSTPQELAALVRKNKCVKVVSFQRNFGKSAALTAGFKEARGSIVFSMDGDLQDDPDEIPNFLKAIKKYDLVVGWKKKRFDPVTKRVPSKFFNWLTSVLTKVNVHDSNCGFKCFRRDVVDSIDIYGELHRYIPAMAHMKGFSVGEVVVKHHARVRGASKFGVERLLKGFLDLLTISFLMKFGERPMHFFGSIGLLLFVVGMAINTHLFYIWVFLREPIGNRPLLFLGVLLTMLGIQFFSVGFLGEMIRAFGKQSQDYVVKK